MSEGSLVFGFFRSTAIMAVLAYHGRDARAPQEMQSHLLSRQRELVGSTRKRKLSTFAEAVAQEVFQIGDVVNLLDRLLDIILDAAERDRVVL